MARNLERIGVENGAPKIYFIRSHSWNSRVELASISICTLRRLNRQSKHLKISST